MRMQKVGREKRTRARKTRAGAANVPLKPNLSGGWGAAFCCCCCSPCAALAMAVLLPANTSLVSFKKHSSNPRAWSMCYKNWLREALAYAYSGAGGGAADVAVFGEGGVQSELHGHGKQLVGEGGARSEWSDKECKNM